MDVIVDVKLTIIIPLHSEWLSEFYNYINSGFGQEITRNGWLRAGITDAIKMGEFIITFTRSSSRHMHRHRFSS